MPTPAAADGAGAQRDAALRAVRDAGLVPEEIDTAALRRRYAVFRANLRSMRAYRPRWVFPGRMLLVRASESPSDLAAWRRLAPAVEERVVPGDHYTIWAPDRLPALAAIVAGEPAG